MAETRLEKVVALIDAANAQDPERHEDDGQSLPGAYLYGRRMSETLERLRPEASEALRIAVRAQHLERWKLPRKEFPEGRAGYYAWRREQARRHAARLAELMDEAGYSEEEAGRAGSLVRKEALKRDPETQALEDCACIVFLAHYADDFIADYDDEKVRDILRKTARKMSPEGLAMAGSLPLSERLGRLLGEALSQ
ncbi:MAG: DUF4202 domain-containing protein [Rhodovibrionaceae bacterium]|nr:DUF4202 domain-containing protein [Rhodovibrionaceae bacterium]